MVFSYLVAAAAFLAPAHLPPPDSLALHREARSAQERFERSRVRHAPISWWSGSGPCDERVGRFCLRFGRESEEEEEDRPSWIPPPDAPEVLTARDDLIATLDEIAGLIPGDGWIAGQRVAYLAEVGRWDDALAAAAACQAEEGWCRGLEGIALHGLGRTLEAAQAFEAFMDSLDPEERDEWTDPGVLGGTEWRRHLGRMDHAQRAQEEERMWRLADPLFLLDGNPLWTEHLSRRVLAMTRETARNGHAMRWGRDMTELLVRYGPVVAYERTREPISYVGPPLVVGRYDPVPRNLMPSFEAIVDPAQSEARDWLTHQRRTISRHAPALARRIHAMDAQITRFREGDMLLVRVDWALTEPPVSLDASVQPLANGQGGAQEDGDPHETQPFPPDSLVAHLFLFDVETLERFEMESRIHDGMTRGSAVIRVPAGRYLLSIEGLDPQSRRAWRQRVGVEGRPAHRGVVTLSDLLLLEPLEAPAPDTPVPALDPELTRALSTLTVPPGPVEVLWEVYGLEGSDAELRFELRVEREGRSLLRRFGEAVRLLGGQDPLEVTWREGVPREEVAGGGPLRRSMVVDLSSLDPGEYELILSATPPGRTTVTTGLRVQVSEGGAISR
ncbi:MAG: hypothetical protein EA422_06950 [Gemmatimonadales bacterium]|nr:MAG: hypothetical protein EA422_06950 [Gemmatimonadales bacterium]